MYKYIRQVDLNILRYLLCSKEMLEKKMLTDLSICKDFFFSTR